VAQLDGSHEDQMPRATDHRRPALHRLEATETSDFYELIVERHPNASRPIRFRRNDRQSIDQSPSPRGWPPETSSTSSWQKGGPIALARDTRRLLILETCKVCRRRLCATAPV